MASGVNVKMGVSGVAQFKQNMTQAKNAVKTLDAQLALSEKQFKASGDAESYMTEKAELLKAKLEQQKTVVANAESALEKMAANGVDRSSTAYQSLYQQMLKAKGEMLDTENAMNGVADAGDSAADGVDAMNQQLARIGQGVSWENVTDGLSKITSGMAGVIKKAWEVGEAIVKATLGAGSWADELKTTASQYGITTTELQQWRKTANLIDTDVDTILTAQDKLKKGREQQGKEYMGAFAYLGIDPTDMSDMDLFWAAGDAIAKLGKEEDKVTYAQQLFGKSWRELLPLFQEGREEWDRTNASWSVVEEDQIDSLGKMDDAYQKMQGEWETFKNEMLSAFSGPLTEGMDAITGLFKELNDYLDTPEGQAMIKQMGETISGLISDLTKVDPEQVVGGLKSVIDGITNALKWIDENRENVKTALEVIAGGFALLKLAEVATNIGKVVSGFQTLWNGANNPLPSVPGDPTGGGSGGGSSWASGMYASATAKAATLSSILSIGGPVIGATVDRFLNETNAGRALRDGGDVLEGLKQDIEEKAEEVWQNAETLSDNWDPNSENANVIAKFFGGRNANQDAADRLGTNNWAPSYMGGGIGNGSARYDEAASKMEAAAEELTGGTNAQKQSSSEMTSAAGTLKGLPGTIESAIIKGMAQIKIYADGQQVANVVTPYVNNAMGGAVFHMAVK